MWSLFQNCKGWSCRPSQAVGITEVYRAYCFDEAVAAWGNYVTGELEKIDGKTDKEVNSKRRNKLLQLLDAPDELRFRKIQRP